MWTNGVFLIIVTLSLNSYSSYSSTVLSSSNEQQTTFRHVNNSSVDLDAVTRTTSRSTHGHHAKRETKPIKKGIGHSYQRTGDTPRTLKRKRNDKRTHHSKVKHNVKTSAKNVERKLNEFRASRSKDKRPKMNNSRNDKRKGGRADKVQLDKNVKSINDTTDKPREEQSIKNNKQKEKAKHDSKSRRLSRKTLRLLREALLEHPFKTWKYNGRFQSMKDLGIHEAQLHDFVDNKWNRRMEQKLEKVLNGENIHLAILGGSNTAGGGIQEDEGDTSRVFYRVISHWWRNTIRPITGSHLKIRQIAMGGTGSDFFQYCYKNYIQDNVDIIFMELSVNDLKQLPPNVNLSLPIEQLTRQLLLFHTHPALLYLNLFSGRTYYQGCVNLEDFGQGLLSDAYKVTTFSWRDAVCPKTVGNFRTPLKSCGVVCKDGHHINLRGHAHISLMVINLFRDLLLRRIIRVHERLAGLFEDKNALPEPVFIQGHSKVIDSPKCWTTLTPNTGKIKINNSMEVGVMENYGFDYHHDVLIGAPCNAPRFCRSDTYSGWTGKDFGASLTLSFTVPALPRRHRGRRSRSVVFATRTCFDCGAAEIWLDDDYMNRKYVAAKSSFSQTYLETIALRVNPGDHTMSVKVVEPGELTAIGVMVGPTDGPY